MQKKASRTNPPAARIAAKRAKRTVLLRPASSLKPLALSAAHPPRCRSYPRAIVPSTAALALPQPSSKREFKKSDFGRFFCFFEKTAPFVFHHAAAKQQYALFFSIFFIYNCILKEKGGYHLWQRATGNGQRIISIFLALAIGLSFVGVAGILFEDVQIFSSAIAAKEKALPFVIADKIAEQEGTFAYQGEMIPELFERENFQMLYDRLAASAEEYPDMSGFWAQKLDTERDKYARDFGFLKTSGDDILDDEQVVNISFTAGTDKPVLEGKYSIEQIEYCTRIYHFLTQDKNSADYGKIHSREELVLLKQFYKKGNPKYFIMYIQNANQDHEPPYAYELKKDEFISAIQLLNGTTGREGKKAAFWEIYNTMKDREEQGKK